jgi:hypothetical protein
MVEVLERPVGVVNIDETIRVNAQHRVGDEAYDLFIKKELKAALAEAADPATKWLSEEEFWDGLV